MAEASLLQRLAVNLAAHTLHHHLLLLLVVQVLLHPQSLAAAFWSCQVAGLSPEFCLQAGWLPAVALACLLLLLLMGWQQQQQQQQRRRRVLQGVWLAQESSRLLQQHPLLLLLLLVVVVSGVGLALVLQRQG
jgi:hypothetical protein